MDAQYRISGRTAHEITASVEDGVRLGAIPPDSHLPSVRGLASDLGVSPATVASAYQRLRQRGVVCTDGRRGTRVRSAAEKAEAAQIKQKLHSYIDSTPF